MPDLRSATRRATIVPDKVTILWTRFYPLVIADLIDIYKVIFADAMCQDALPLEKSVTPDEIQALLCTRKANKAPGSNLISNNFLKAIGRPLATAVAALASACWNLGHYPA
jgi:hypothetical protein